MRRNVDVERERYAEVMPPLALPAWAGLFGPARLPSEIVERLNRVTLKHATLVRTSTVNEAVETLRSGNAEAVAALKTFLFPASDKVPGSRVLEGRTYVEDIGIGVPKGRGTSGAAYVRKFVEEAKASGLMKATIDKAAQRGFIAAP